MAGGSATIATAGQIHSVNIGYWIRVQANVVELRAVIGGGQKGGYCPTDCFARQRKWSVPASWFYVNLIRQMTESNLPKSDK